MQRVCSYCGRYCFFSIYGQQALYMKPLTFNEWYERFTRRR